MFLIWAFFIKPLLVNTVISFLRRIFGYGVTENIEGSFISKNRRYMTSVKIGIGF